MTDIKETFGGKAIRIIRHVNNLTRAGIRALKHPAVFSSIDFLTFLCPAQR